MQDYKEQMISILDKVKEIKEELSKDLTEDFIKAGDILMQFIYQDLEYRNNKDSVIENINRRVTNTPFTLELKRAESEETDINQYGILTLSAKFWIDNNNPKIDELKDFVRQFTKYKNIENDFKKYIEEELPKKYNIDSIQVDYTDIINIMHIRKYIRYRMSVYINKETYNKYEEFMN